MLSIIKSMSLTGLDGYLVFVQVDISAGMPGFEIVGLPDTSIKEAKERVKTAIRNSGYELKSRKIVINLAPADTKIEGSFFDLPIAVGILESVGEVNKDKIENIGYSLYDIEYAKEGPNYYLRIYIDSPNGIDLNDCEKVSNEINDVLDEANYIKEQDFLEVSSPGIERILRKDSHLEQNIGNQVEVKLFKKDENGNKSYIGELKEFDEDTITVEAIEEVKIERKNIAQIKTIYDWDNDVNDEN